MVLLPPHGLSLPFPENEHEPLSLPPPYFKPRSSAEPFGSLFSPCSLLFEKRSAHDVSFFFFFFFSFTTLTNYLSSSSMTDRPLPFSAHFFALLTLRAHVFFFSPFFPLPQSFFLEPTAALPSLECAATPRPMRKNPPFVSLLRSDRSFPLFSDLPFCETPVFFLLVRVFLLASPQQSLSSWTSPLLAQWLFLFPPLSPTKRTRRRFFPLPPQF